MVQTVKFSDFTTIVKISTTNFLVGASAPTGGVNVKSPLFFTWTTATRPSPPYNGLNGYNTDLDDYEFWNGSFWISHGSLVEVDTGTGLTGGPITSIGTISFAPINAQSLWANLTGSTAVPTNVSLAALTKVDDTNVTLTLGGTPATALINAVSLTLGWTGLLSGSRGGTGINNGSNTATFAGNLNFASSFTTSGSFSVTQIYTGITSIVMPETGTVATLSDIPAPPGGETLTVNSDTNVTLTPGGNYLIALLNSASITAGWSGQLSLARGGSNASLTASNGGIVYSTASAMAILSGTATAGQILQSGLSSAPSWSTATYPSIAGTSGNFIKSDGTNFLSTSGSALTKVDDTNVTLTLGGSASTSLVNAASLTLGWTGQLSVPRGGTDNSTFTAYSVICAGTTATGAFQNVSGVGTASQVLVSNGPSALPTWQAVPGLVPAALTRTNDTNVTVTLGGTPATSLLQAVSLTLGWTGQLSMTRGGSSASLTPNNGGIIWTSATQMQVLAGTATAGQILRSGATATPSWSTATYPATAGSSGNVIVSDGTNFNSSAITSITALGAQSQALNMNSHLINNVTDPVSAQDAATKNFVTTKNYFNSINLQQFSSGTGQTYTPSSSGVVFVLVEIIGGGGGAGGVTGSASMFSTSGGGAGGGYCRRLYTAAQIGASAAIDVGSGGSGGSAGNNNGSDGGDSDFAPAGAGAELFAPGGTHGTGAGASTTLTTSGSAIANTPTGGDINIPGQDGGAGAITSITTGIFLLASGGSSFFGSGSPMLVKAFGNNYTGHDGIGYGSGGGGAGCQTTSKAGGNGTAGVCLVYEYIST